MSLQNNAVFLEDMEMLGSLPEMEELCGKTVLVTGATGLIGRTLVSALLHYGKKLTGPAPAESAASRIHVIACVRDAKKAEGMFGSLDRGNLELLVTDILSMPTDRISQKIDYVVHAASQTASRAFVDHPVETILTAVEGTRRALEFAKNNGARAFAYLSSMEVYGAPSDDGKIDESHGTDLDTMQARSCYPESKRLCESLCASYQKEYGLPVRVLRLTQTFGPGVRYDDGRVFAEFARCALEGRDIVLRTAGDTCRSYLYTADAASAILAVLLRGADGVAYNAANEKTYCSIRQMADLVAADRPLPQGRPLPDLRHGQTGAAAGQVDENKSGVAAEEPARGRGSIANAGIRVRIELAGDPGKLGYAPTLHMNLDTARLRALGWRPTRDLADMYRRMMAAMRQEACHGRATGTDP